MKIVMIGTGYVGLVTGTCFAESGNDVTCVDVDADKIARLNNGEVPIYEPGLSELIHRNTRAGRLKFTTNYAEAVPGAKCVFLCVGTPPLSAAQAAERGEQEGAANLEYVFAAARTAAGHLDDDAVVVVKSTVPVGTNRKVAEILKDETGSDAAVASNPEFLKEGAAVDDFTKPDRVVVGVTHESAADRLHELYKPFLRTERPFLSMGLESAEMTKYVANCMLATKISFINEMANLCELVGADVNDVRRGIGHDERIGFSFLFPGVGYGGSCFPKDVRALISTAERRGMHPQIMKSVDDVNQAQKEVLFNKLKRRFDGELSGRKIAVWGLAFKPRTDDVREAPSLVLIDHLLEAGAEVSVHDPVAMDNVRAIYGDRLTYCDHHYKTVPDADALVICTEWNEFRNPDFAYIKHEMRDAVIIDGRNLFDPRKLAALGIRYEGVGLPVVEPAL